MYKFLYVDRDVLKRFPSNVYNFLWMPMILAGFPSCKPRDLYLLDCIFSDVCESPYTVLFLMNKISRRDKLVDEMPVEARKASVKECSTLKAIQNLQTIAHEISNENYLRLEQFIDRISEFTNVEIPYRVFLRTRKYVIPAERIRQTSLRIARKSAKRVLESLCLIKDDVATSTEVDGQPVYVLAYYSKDYSDSGFIVGKKILRGKALARILKTFSERVNSVIA
ncbi:MAG: hypothetical protein QXT53_03470 [Ignisphaera sp.]